MDCNHSYWNKLDVCYFCGRNLKDDEDPPIGEGERRMQLADSCYVPACMNCIATLEESKKLVEAKVLDNPLRLSVLRKPTTSSGITGNGRYSPLKIEKGSTGSDNISVSFVEDKKITKLKILNEGEMNTYIPKDGSDDKPSTRLLVEISYENQKTGDPTHWRMNNKSRNALIDVWGYDTQKWVSSEAEISIAGEGEFRHIMVDVLRTK